MVTALYGSLLAVLVLALSVRVIGIRRSRRVGLGDGGDVILRRRIRAHGNLTEYAPMTLILLALAELQGAPHWSLHVLGAMFIIGRIIHAIGLGQEPEPRRMRVIGVALTLTVLSILAVQNLLLSLSTM